MHANGYLQHVVVLEKGITAVLRIVTPDIKQPHLDMGIKWNGTLVIPPPVSPWVKVGKGLTVQVYFAVFGLAQLEHFAAQLTTRILTSSNVRIHVRTYRRKLVEILGIQRKSHSGRFVFENFLYRHVLVFEKSRIDEGGFAVADKRFVLGKEL